MDENERKVRELDEEIEWLRRIMVSFTCAVDYEIRTRSQYRTLRRLEAIRDEARRGMIGG